MTAPGASLHAARMPRRLLDFLRQNKAWWLAPILLVALLLLGVLLFGVFGGALPSMYRVP